MNDLFLMAAVVTPLMVVVTAGIISLIAIRADNRWLKLARERGELPPAE